MWEKINCWFGYRLHLIVDADYELPVAFTVTPASYSEEAHALINDLSVNKPEILTRCETFIGDRGYDDSKLIITLWDDYGIKPVIDIRNLWKDGEPTRLLKGRDNIVYYRGTVYCCCPKELKLKRDGIRRL